MYANIMFLASESLCLLFYSGLHYTHLWPLPCAGMFGKCLALLSLQTTWEAPQCMS